MPRMASDDVIVLHDYGLVERQRKGKSRYTVQFKAEPIVHNLDPMALGKVPAEAIAKFFRDRITGIAATAAPATIRARESAAKALGAGKAWATRRYAGGRIGAMDPGRSISLFNDSGRLAKSIAVGATRAGAYVVNVAANRLDPNTLDNGGAGALARIYAKLVEFVPELADPKALLDSLPVRRAIRDATAAMVQQLDAAHSKSSIEIVRKLIEIGHETEEIAEAAAG